MMRLWAHMRRLWPRWTLLPPAPFVLYGLVMLLRGELRWDHVAMMVLVPALAYTSEKSKKLCEASYAMGLVGLFYDAMRYFRNVGVSPERVHLCDLRAMEIKLFGVTMGGERVTVHDWFLTHHWDALDLWCAVPYGTFIFASLGCAVVLYGRDYRAVQHFAWGFFLMNVVGFATYHIYPAAPPWYYHAHGCFVDMAANPQAGPRLEHVDAMLGFDRETIRSLAFSRFAGGAGLQVTLRAQDLGAIVRAACEELMAAAEPPRSAKWRMLRQPVRDDDLLTFCWSTGQDTVECSSYLIALPNVTRWAPLSKIGSTMPVEPVARWQK